MKVPTQNLLMVLLCDVVDDEDCVGNSLLQIWKLRFGHKAKLLFRLCTRFGQDFEIEVRARFVW